MSIHRAFVKVVVRVSVGLLTMLSGCALDVADPSTSDPTSVGEPVIGGVAATTCQWPSCVVTDGCTATLVHPKMITTARHCLASTPRQIVFGETRSTAQRTVRIDRCVRHPSRDVGFCLLA